MIYRMTLLTMITALTCSCQVSKKNAINNQEDRVQTAFAEKTPKRTQRLQQLGLDLADIHIALIAYKNKDELQLYAKNTSQETYQLIESYPICQRSGILGPKKAEGDKQVPEGFYHIDRFNPKSSFYLSLGINYPNMLDQSLGYTGSDIFIHGKCETVGCLPMTDEFIKEIYCYALSAKKSGQQAIPVYIFPFEMTNENIQAQQQEVDVATVSFWKNLQEGYQIFKTTHKEVPFSIQNGKYIF